MQTLIGEVPLARDLVSPVALTASPLAPDEIFIADQVGVIYSHNLRSRTTRRFIDRRTIELNPDYDERGLLGIAFHPTEPRLFTFYSAMERATAPMMGAVPPGTIFYNRISEWVLDEARPPFETILAQIACDHPYHNGGSLAFGPDNHLYVSVGDGGPQRDPRGNAQNLLSPRGKILRLDVNTRGRYRVPRDNPFGNEIWAYGLRNPWGISFHDDVLISADAGFERAEEINIIVRGENYGWNLKEGFEPTPWTSRANAHTIDPIYSYKRGQFASLAFQPSVSAIVGGYMTPHGYICGDFGGVMLLVEPNNVWQLKHTEPARAHIKAFGRGLEGEIYALTSLSSGPKGTSGMVGRLNIQPLSK